MRIDVQIDNDGLLIGGVSGDDLVVIGKLDIDGDGVIDYNGVLLTAEIVEFGFHDTGGTIDYFDFRFRVTGGLLESRYNNKDVGLHLTSECSDFTGSFNVDFSGKAKGKLGAMPICCTGTIGDFIWHDLDRDGIQDAGESGIQGVTVRLEDSSGSPVADTSTGIDGFYEFTGLCAGDYTVVVDESTLPPGYIFTPLDQGGDDTVDNDGSPYTVTLPANDSNDPTVDFGFNYPCTGVIGDKVWYDVNRDGIQNAGESGLDRIEVKLKDSSGDVIALDVTDENGNYRFEGLCAGDYTVEVNEQTLPPGFIETPVDQGNDDTIDNDGSPAVVTLSDDLTEDLTIDFGYISPCQGSIGDFVWDDRNRDGIQDAGEPGINGVTVYLKDSSDMPIATTTTGSNGAYAFNGLCAGTYTVEVDESTLLPDFVATPVDQGGDDTVDSDPSPVSVTLTDDITDNPTLDFGYNSPCTGALGDLVWHDVNRDGIQDAGELGISGIKVILKDETGSVIGTATTDGNGAYGFTGLCSGTYTLEVDKTTLPPDFVATPVDQGGDDTVDSDPSPVSVILTDDITENPTLDFGYNSPCTGTLGDLVWHDVNRDGIQDAGELGIPGITVILKDDAGTIIATDSTDGSGIYGFTGLCAGTYRVEVDETTLPPDFVVTPVDQGGDDTVDSDPSPITVTLTDDITENPTLDFGYNSPCTGALGDLVWHDVNRDGIQDAGELGIPGITVILKDNAGTVIATESTDGSGAYGFTGLCAGTYTVEVDETTLPPDFVATPVDQ
ncbi:MAG: hypothetical protein GY737_30065, partial [Desulfobacteraceae bacterium]|nr:hypothetical protein [Desulfobacteraceae bacterium]